MAQRCTVCLHTERVAIDKALLASEPLRRVAARFGVSVTALHRHGATHLLVQLAKAKEADDVGHAIDVVKQLRVINAEALQVLAEARKAGANDLRLRAIDRVLRQVEFQARLIGQLDERPQVTLNVLAMPEYIAARDTLLDVVAAHPDLRVEVARRLMAQDRAWGTAH